MTVEEIEIPEIKKLEEEMMGRTHRLRRIALGVASIVLAGVVSSTPAVADYDSDGPVDDPVDCYLYGGWDWPHGVECEDDSNWVSNDVALIEDQVDSLEPSPSPTQEPSPEPSPTPTETPRDKPGNGPKK